jgi:RNA polymerase sigma-70 factor (ECF subfamily)
MTRFITTRWTLIADVRRDDDRARQAMTELCQTYWRPVYAYVRRHGHTPEQAADLTQSFFLHLLEHRGFERADPLRGRFRSYLLTSARNFLSNERDRSATLRRGGGASFDPIDLVDAERQLAQENVDPQFSPEAAFERQWALRIMERAIETLGREYTARGQAALFAHLRTFLTSDATADLTPSGESAAAPDLTDAALRTAVHRLRKRFGAALRAEIEDTVGSAADVDDELRHLLRIMSQ